MKILYFDDFRLGILRGDEVVDVSDQVQDIPHTGPHDLITGLIARLDDYRARIEKAAAEGVGIPVANVRIRPPLPKPGNIDCMAVNYMENGTLPEPTPINAFHKASNGVIGEGDTMVLPDIPAKIFEGEAELGLVIGGGWGLFGRSRRRVAPVVGGAASARTDFGRADYDDWT